MRKMSQMELVQPGVDDPHWHFFARKVETTNDSVYGSFIWEHSVRENNSTISNNM